MGNRTRVRARLLGVMVLLTILIMGTMGARGCFSSSTKHAVGSSAPVPLADLVKTWGGANNDQTVYDGHAVAVDNANNIYLAGRTTSFGAGSYDTVLLKYDSAGTVQWAKTWGSTGNDSGYALDMDTSGNIYVTGYTTETGTANVECFVIKYDADGISTTARTWGGASSEKGWSIAVDSANNAVYVCGETATFGEGGTDVFLLKYDSALTAGPVWEKRWGSTGSDTPNDIALDANGDIYLAGRTTATGSANLELSLFKCLSDGTLVWAKTWGGGGVEEVYSVAVDGDYVYMAGSTPSLGAGDYDSVLLKYDASDGTLVWEMCWGSVGYEEAYDIAADPATGNIYVTAYIEGFGVTNSAVALLKYNSAGTLLDSKAWWGDDWDYPGSVVVKGLNVYLAGYIDNCPPLYLDTCAWYDITGTETPVTGVDVPATDQVWADVVGGTDADIYGDSDRIETTPAGDETGAGNDDILLLRIAK